MAATAAGAPTACTPACGEGVGRVLARRVVSGAASLAGWQDDRVCSEGWVRVWALGAGRIQEDSLVWRLGGAA